MRRIHAKWGKEKNQLRVSTLYVTATDERILPAYLTLLKGGNSHGQTGSGDQSIASSVVGGR